MTATSSMTVAMRVQCSAIWSARDAGGDGLRRPLGLGARLGVERLELAGAAGHPEQDAGAALLLHFAGVGAEGVGPAQAGDGGAADGQPAQEAATADGAARRSRGR